MSEDIIGWSELKRINIRERIDRGAELKENADRSRTEYWNLIKEQGSNNPLRDTLVDSLDAIYLATRMNLIYISALREGMIQVEQRLSKIEEKLGI